MHPSWLAGFLPSTVGFGPVVFLWSFSSAIEPWWCLGFPNLPNWFQKYCQVTYPQTTKKKVGSRFSLVGGCNPFDGENKNV